MAIEFVTGGSGFVGRALIGALRQRGDQVRALARSESAARAVREAGAEPVRGDLDDVAAMREGMRGAHAVFHAAAKVDDWGDPADFDRINVAGTESALRAAREAGVGVFVHVGTEAMLVGSGAPKIRMADETWPRPKKPIGEYPRTKGIADERVRAFDGPGLRTVVVRPRFVWGNGDTTVLPRFVDAVKKGQFAWFDHGRYLTSTCHVDNLCHALLLAEEKGRGGEAYFVTDGEPLAMRDFLTRMLATQGVTPPERSVPFRAAHAAVFLMEAAYRIAGRKAPPPLTHAALHLMGEEVTVSDQKARRELGYAPVVSLDEGMARLRGGAA